MATELVDEAHVAENLTYFKDHKDLPIPPDFGTTENKENEFNLNKNRRDYKSLPKVKLFTISDVLSVSDCNKLINITSTNKNIGGYTSIQFEYPTNYRKCERVVCKSFELANIIWNKIKLYFNRDDIENIRPFGFGNDGIWRPTNINEVFRFTRYRNNDFFTIHRDGGYVKSNTNRSVYTFMIYLNDNSDFDGGSTIFYSPKTKQKPGDHDENEENYKLFLSEDDKNNASKVEIVSKTGMAVIFNHDVWHEGCTVITNHDNNKYKYILRTDIMFQRYSAETFNINNLLTDPLFLKSQYLYKMTVDLQEKGKPLESTISYLQALSIQTALPSIISDKDNDYFGAEYEWFPNDVFEHIFGFLDVYRLIPVSYVSRAFYYYATSPVLWRHAYNKYFNMKNVIDVNDGYNNSVLFRPWKHIFSYRVTMKKTFPILALNIWYNAIEIGQISKGTDDDHDGYDDLDDPDDDGEDNCDYIPFAVSRYRKKYSWGCDERGRETFYGRVIFKGDTDTDGYTSPQWIIDENNILNGINFYKLLKEILYIPNVVISLPSLMYTNESFILYLKHTLTKFVENENNFTKIFCLYIKNMEEEIAKHYKAKKCIVIINEHRSFSISVVKDYKLINDDKLIKKYIATTSKIDEEDNVNKETCNFPHNFLDYKFEEFHVTNLSNFNFLNEDDNISYYETGQKNDELKIKLESYFMDIVDCKNEDDEATETNEDDDAMENNEHDNTFSNIPYEYIDKLKIFNDDKITDEIIDNIYCGPNNGSKYEEIPKRNYKYYQRQNAPFSESLCYTPMDIILALNDILNQCKDCKIFDHQHDNNDGGVVVINVGPLTLYYSKFIESFFHFYNDSDKPFDLDRFMPEPVTNNNNPYTFCRSSGLQSILQTVLSPKEISHFEGMNKIIEQFQEMEKNILRTDAKTKIIKEMFSGRTGAYEFTSIDTIKRHFHKEILLIHNHFEVTSTFKRHFVKERNYGFRSNDNIYFKLLSKEYAIWKFKLNIEYQLEQQTDLYQQACTLCIEERMCSTVILQKDEEIGELLQKHKNKKIENIIDSYVVGDEPPMPLIKVTTEHIDFDAWWSAYDDDDDSDDDDDDDEWLTFDPEPKSDGKNNEKNEIHFDADNVNKKTVTLSRIMSWEKTEYNAGVETKVTIENTEK